MGITQADVSLIQRNIRKRKSVQHNHTCKIMLPYTISIKVILSRNWLNIPNCHQEDYRAVSIKSWDVKFDLKKTLFYHSALKMCLQFKTFCAIKKKAMEQVHQLCLLVVLWLSSQYSILWLMHLSNIDCLLFLNPG